MYEIFNNVATLFSPTRQLHKEITGVGSDYATEVGLLSSLRRKDPGSD